MAAKKKVPAKKVAPAKGKPCKKCGKMGSACKC
jgi:hypothetical protein